MTDNDLEFEGILDIIETGDEYCPRCDKYTMIKIDEFTVDGLVIEDYICTICGLRRSGGCYWSALTWREVERAIKHLEHGKWYNMAMMYDGYKFMLYLNGGSLNE
jgi:hypothetical protein